MEIRFLEDLIMEIRFDQNDPGTFVAYKVTSGGYLEKDSIVLEYKDSSGSSIKVKAAEGGVVTTNRELKKGVTINKDCLLYTMNPCTHGIVIKDLCAECGKDLRERDGHAGQRTERAEANVSMIHHVPELHVSNEIAKHLGEVDQDALLKARKLVLLVDLDQTIIHTTDRPFKYDPKQNPDIFEFQLQRGTNIGRYFTKIRPYTMEFLNKLSKLYEFHIISYGQRQYTHTIAKNIDPEKKLFGERVMSRDELFSPLHKTANLKALFPHGDKMITIIDDRADVWQYSEALVNIKAYRYFREVGDINAPQGSKDAAPTVDIEENAHEDRVLEHIEKVLTDIHTNFYKYYDDTKEIRDVKVIISWLKKQVLRDSKIVLSGVVPLNQNYKESEIYMLIIAFGGEVQDNVTDETDIVVAARWGTSKVNAAAKKGIPVVTPLWIYACVHNWHKADAKEYELSKDSVFVNDRQNNGTAVGMMNMDVINKNDLESMENEVDEALSEGDDEDEAETKNNDGAEDFDEDADDGLDKSCGDSTDPTKASTSSKRKAGEQKSDYESPTKRTHNKHSCDEDSASGPVAADDDEDDEVDYGREDDDEETRDIPYDSDDDQEFEDMAALIERQMTED